jgi:hypothetical protein
MNYRRETDMRTAERKESSWHRLSSISVARKLLHEVVVGNAIAFSLLDRENGSGFRGSCDHDN